MDNLIDRPIYNTADLSHIYAWPTSYIRKCLKRRYLWSSHIPIKIENQIVASYRDFVFLDIDHFLCEQPIKRKTRYEILSNLSYKDQFFKDNEITLSTDGVDVFGVHKDTGSPASNTDVMTDQIIFTDILEPLLTKRVFSNDFKTPEWRPDEDFKDILIHPAIVFGKPHIRGHRIKTTLFYDIWQAHKMSAQDIAGEYDIEDSSLVEQAIEFERKRQYQNRQLVH